MQDSHLTYCRVDLGSYSRNNTTNKIKLLQQKGLKNLYMWSESSSEQHKHLIWTENKNGLQQ